MYSFVNSTFIEHLLCMRPCPQRKPKVHPGTDIGLPPFIGNVAFTFTNWSQDLLHFITAHRTLALWNKTRKSPRLAYTRNLRILREGHSCHSPLYSDHYLLVLLPRSPGLSLGPQPPDFLGAGSGAMKVWQVFSSFGEGILRFSQCLSGIRGMRWL